MTTLSRIPLALALAASLAACGGDDDEPASTQNAVEVAQGNPELSILVEAVTAAGLGETLSGPGPFTIFAPTNEAFTRLLGELGVTKEELLANEPLLTAVLKYHVLAAEVPSAQVPIGKAIEPIGGGFFKVDRSDTGLVVTDGRNRTSNVVTADVETSNGVVHVVDGVLLPADKNVVETAMALPEFSILVEAVQAAGLAEALSADGPFTVFAPTNDAFVALLDELGVSKEHLLADTELLTAVLTYHVLGARVLAADVVPGVQPPTLQGESFSIGADLVVTDGRSRTANLAATDVLASNGVIHVVDRVILPGE